MPGVLGQPIDQPADVIADPGCPFTGQRTLRSPPKPDIYAGLPHLDLAAGADNLLGCCIGAKAGERLLVLREDSSHGFYDCAVSAFVADYARVIGLDVTEIEVDAPESGRGLPMSVAKAMLNVDHALFFARIGDQLRFEVMPGHCSKTISYAFDAACLGSRFGTTPHHLMRATQGADRSRVAVAGEIRITCPLGTDVVGAPSA